MVVEFGQGSPSAGGEQLASPSQARSVAAVFASVGAKPHEVDGAVLIHIEMLRGKGAPRSYQEILQGPIDALEEYRRRNIDAVPED